MARKILLADDSVTAQNMGRKILTDAGYEVITVNNGSAALKKVGEQKPDLIVLDVYMPGYSGLEVCQRLKDAPETARIPILLTVGKLEPFKPEEARRVRAEAFIIKPFEASELLSALTRMEDRMVPQGDGSRFANSISGIERFGGEESYGRKSDATDTDADTGWKSRLRFPSKKKKVEESEPEPEDFGVTPIRDFRQGKSAPPAPSGKAPISKQEPGLVPEIPRDITPAELDALSALAAKLDGPIPEAEDIVPVGGQLGPAEAAAKTEPVAESKAAEETPAAVAAPSNSPETKVEEKLESQPGEAVSETPAVAGADALPPVEETPAKAEETVATFELHRIEPDLTEAPVDRDDEPMFATVAIAPETAKENNVPTEIPKTEASEETPAKIAQETAPIAEEAPSTEAKLQVAEEVKAGSEPEEAKASESSTESDHVPTEEELAEALRLLTPSSPASGSKDGQEGVTIPADVVQALTEAGQNAGLVGRWAAEKVALTEEESSISLEAEMFQKFSMTRWDEQPTASAAKEAQEAKEAEALPSAVPEPSVEQTVGETPVASGAPVAVVQDSAAGAAPEKEEELAPVQEQDQPATASAVQPSQDQQNEAQPEVRAEESQPVAEVVAESQKEASASMKENEPATQSAPESTSDQEAGGEDMGKDGKKAGWHQIRSVAAPAPVSSDPVQAAKDAAVSTEETPKAMAAAAGAEAVSLSEAGAIASIVDSVLADLKPKIVEEIAKKLAKK